MVVVIRTFAVCCDGVVVMAMVINKVVIINLQLL